MRSREARRFRMGWYAAPLLAAASALFVSRGSAGLVPGGGPTRSDCYVELDVQGVEPPVGSNRIVQCTDGDACDTDGVCGNDSCTLGVAVCSNQSDPNLPDCTAPSSLVRLKLPGGRVRILAPDSLQGSACGSLVGLTVPVKVRRNGTKRPGRVVLRTLGTAVQGTTPRKDRDAFVLQCLPRTLECPGVAGPSTTTTTLAGPTVRTVTVGPGGDLRFDPETVRVPVGGTVRWRFASPGHNVVSGSGGNSNGVFCSPNDSGCGNAPLSNSGAVYEHTFNEAGTFPYFCSPHVSQGMRGAVVVEP